MSSDDEWTIGLLGERQREAFARLFAFFCLGLQSASWTFQCCNCVGSTDWSAVPVSLLLYVSFAQLLVGASVRWCCSLLLELRKTNVKSGSAVANATPEVGR